MNAKTPKMNKLTILVESSVYKGLHEKIGRGNISKYINDAVKPFVTRDIDSDYAAMATDTARNREAATWTDSMEDFGSENTW